MSLRGIVMLFQTTLTTPYGHVNSKLAVFVLDMFRW